MTFNGADICHPLLIVGQQNQQQDKTANDRNWQFPVCDICEKDFWKKRPFTESVSLVSVNSTYLACVLKDDGGPLHIIILVKFEIQLIYQLISSLGVGLIACSLFYDRSEVLN